MCAARQCLFGGTCTTEGWRGMHQAVVQKQVTTVKDLENAKGTLLASVREADMPSGCAVICTSYYDTKPFHMMSNIVDGVEIISIYRRCFNNTTMQHFYGKLQ
jgi:hypothetical protein